MTTLDMTGKSFHPKWGWRQESPMAQYRVIYGAIQGWLDNLKEGSKPDRVTPQIQRLLEQINDLLPYVVKGVWDGTYPFVEQEKK